MTGRDGMLVAVRPRWSDMDVFGHVNHASMVTLLEEARVPLLFGTPERPGLASLARGVVVVSLSVDYRAPVVVSGGDIGVELWLRQLRAASMTIDYVVHDGPSKEDSVAVRAQTVLAPYDTEGLRPRRLSDAERAFLADALPGAEGGPGG